MDKTLAIILAVMIPLILAAGIYTTFYAPCDSAYIQYMPAKDIPGRCLINR